MTEAQCAARHLIGRTLASRYVIVDVLGEGATSVVYRGFEIDGLAEVAVKVLRPEFAANRKWVRRFHREATLAGRVGHANVVRIRTYGTDGAAHYIVMELCSGTTLAKAIARDGPLNQARATNLMLQLCGALSVAHARGLVHRDIKPDNIMLIDAGARIGERVTLVDFGVAKDRTREDASLTMGLGGEEKTDLTAVGALVGTPWYMAPEQCAGGVHVDARADVYACGVLLFEMVTGRPPFDGKNVFEICAAHINTPPPSTMAAAPSILPELDGVIQKALAKSPQDRYQSADELRVALAAVLEHILATELDPTQPLQQAELTALAHQSVDPLGVFSDPFGRNDSSPPSSSSDRPSSLPARPGKAMKKLAIAAMLCAVALALASVCYCFWTFGGVTSRTGRVPSGETCLRSQG